MLLTSRIMLPAKLPGRMVTGILLINLLSRKLISSIFFLSTLATTLKNWVLDSSNSREPKYFIVPHANENALAT